MDTELLIRPVVAWDGSPVDSQSSPDDWEEVRRQCVGASEVGRLVKKNGQRRAGWDQLLWEKATGFKFEPTSFMQIGLEREPMVAAWVIENYPQEGFSHNTGLLQGKKPRHVATPDMIGRDSLCEIKVSGYPLDKIRSKYHDQMQWQMHVTSASYVLFVVLNRDSNTVECEWTYRDQDRIDVLANAADAFLDELDWETRHRHDPLVSKVHFGNEKPHVAIEGSQSEEPHIDTDVAFASEMDAIFQTEGPDLPESELLDLDEFVGVVTEVRTESWIWNPDFREWSEAEKAEIVGRWILGESIEEISERFGVEVTPIGECLSRLLFGLRGNLIDESAENFGSAWSSVDVSILTRSYRLQIPIPEIAIELGRDQLGVAWQIIKRLSPVVPKELLVELEVDSVFLHALLDGFTLGSAG